MIGWVRWYRPRNYTYTWGRVGSRGIRARNTKDAPSTLEVVARRVNPSETGEVDKNLGTT